MYDARRAAPLETQLLVSLGGPPFDWGGTRSRAKHVGCPVTAPVASRLDHYTWPDGSVEPGTPVYDYAGACALYEARRRSLPATFRVALRPAHDVGFCVDSSFSPGWIRATPGNVRSVSPWLHDHELRSEVQRPQVEGSR